MKKEIVLLTTSKKKGNYCIAGVDLYTGEWVRIISDDENIQRAVTRSDMEYKDGNMPKILDIVSIECKGPNPSPHQPENYLLDNQQDWEKKGELTINELLTIHPAEEKSLLFFNKEKRVDVTTLIAINDNERYSLIMISPEDICVHVKDWKERKQVTVSFDYAGTRYWYIPVTDTEFENKYLQYPDGNYKMNEDCLFVISLGDEYSDRSHYKLIAQVIYI